MESEIAKFLKRDHDDLDETFDQFREYKQLGDLVKARECFIHFKRDLTRHMELEEEILFVFYERRSGKKDLGWTAVMRQEHQQLREITQKILNELQRGNLDINEQESEFLDVFKGHNGHEEDVLYSAIDVVTTEDEKKEIFVRMRNFSKEYCK